jgi:hypothetical protein
MHKLFYQLKYVYKRLKYLYMRAKRLNLIKNFALRIDKYKGKSQKYINMC